MAQVGLIITSIIINLANLHVHRIIKCPGLFAKLLPEVMCSTLSYLGLDEVMHFGLACRSCYSASRHKSLWQKMIDDTEHVVVFDQAKGEPDTRSHIINIWV
jgi:hypothetical protein